MHVGGALRAIARHYSDPMFAIGEFVQNSLDERASHISIDIDHNKRRIRVYDNGNGASFDIIQKKFTKFCQTLKADDSEAIGRFGIGLSGGLELAEEFTLITKPAIDSKHPFVRYSMNREIWSEEEPYLNPIKEDEGFSMGEWFTAVVLKKVEESKLRVFSDPASIAAHIADQYGAVISKRKVSIMVKVAKGSLVREEFVKVSEFPGVRERAVTQTTSRGPVIFEMWKTVRPVRNPKIMVEHQGKSSFRLRNISDLWNAVEDALGMGYFQGRVKVNFCTPHHNRKGFLLDEDLLIFSRAVEKYVNEYVRPIINKLEQEHVLERNAEIIRECVDDFEKFLSDMPDLLPEGLRGLVTKDHTGAEEKPRTRENYLGEIRGNDKKKRGNPVKESGEPRGEYDITHPSVEDPRGKPRRIIRGQKGITIRQEEASPESGIDWRTRYESGIIYFNISNPDWIYASDRRSKDRGKSAKFYCGMQIMKELTCLRLKDIDQLRAEDFRRQFERTFMQYWKALVQ